MEIAKEHAATAFQHRRSAMRLDGALKTFAHRRLSEATLT
jgi:hypothetical protein